MLDRRPYIDAILAEPDDDTPRLIFADYLPAVRLIAGSPRLRCLEELGLNVHWDAEGIVNEVVAILLASEHLPRSLDLFVGRLSPLTPHKASGRKKVPRCRAFVRAAHASSEPRTLRPSRARSAAE